MQDILTTFARYRERYYGMISQLQLLAAELPLQAGVMTAVAANISHPS